MEVAPSLHASGRLAVDDYPLFAGLCFELFQWREAVTQMTKLADGKNPLNGAVQKTPNGFWEPSALQNLKNRSFQNILSLTGHFGLSAAERARMKVSSPDAGKKQSGPAPKPRLKAVK